MEDRKDQSIPKNLIKYKFIRRVLKVDSSRYAQELTAYVKMRRMYLKKVGEVFPKKHREWYSYSTQKQLNCVTSFETSLYYGCEDRKVLGHLKNLKNLNLTFPYSSTKLLVRLFKQLTKSIETITLHGIDVETNPTEIESFYKNLGSFQKLRSLHKDISYENAQNEEEQGSIQLVDYNSINKYIPRLKSLKDLSGAELHNGVQGLQKFMSQGVECPSQTRLTLNLMQPRFDGMVTHSFNFQLFPSLCNLIIFACGTRTSLDSSIVQGFKSLVQLKQFTCTTLEGVQGTKFVFEGLRHLPLLDLFSLSKPNTENDEELLLIEFLQRQTQLVSLALSTSGEVLSRERYEQQNRNLEIICQSLSGMSRLKYLMLNGYAWSLESLSRGLSHVGLTNQLKELRITAFEDISSSSGNKVKGLCDFIERQKLSIRVLCIALSCVKEDEIVDSLIRAVGETSQLESLSFSLNNPYHSSLENNQLLKDIPRESLEGYPSFNHTFACISQVLPRLKELTYLNLELNPLLFPFDVPMIDSSMIFDSLSSLKHLIELTLCLPFLGESFRARRAQLIQQLCNMDSLTGGCNITTADDIDGYIEEIYEARNKTGQQRYFRQNLEF